MGNIGRKSSNHLQLESALLCHARSKWANQDTWSHVTLLSRWPSASAQPSTCHDQTNASNRHQSNRTCRENRWNTSFANRVPPSVRLRRYSANRDVQYGKLSTEVQNGYRVSRHGPFFGSSQKEILGNFEDHIIEQRKKKRREKEELTAASPSLPAGTKTPPLAENFSLEEPFFFLNSSFSRVHCVRLPFPVASTCD